MEKKSGFAWKIFVCRYGFSKRRRKITLLFQATESMQACVIIRLYDIRPFVMPISEKHPVMTRMPNPMNQETDITYLSAGNSKIKGGRAGHATHVAEDLVILVAVCPRILIVMHAYMRASRNAAHPTAQKDHRRSSLSSLDRR